MEADIIVEGFKNSMSMHNLKYGQIIGKYHHQNLSQHHHF